MFQSSPGFGAGRYIRWIFKRPGAKEFQSSPGFGAGRYPLSVDDWDSAWDVSILARLWGRALRCAILIPGV